VLFDLWFSLFNAFSFTDTNKHFSVIETLKISHIFSLLSKSLSFWDEILRSSTNLTAERSPNSGMLIIGTGANGTHHSSLTL